MTEMTDRRRDSRISIRVDAHYSFGRVVEVGLIANISYSGALIESTTMRPEIGTPVVLYVDLKPPSAFEATIPFELAGQVVRHSPTGFAIEYRDRLDPDLRRIVDAVVAVVAISR